MKANLRKEEDLITKILKIDFLNIDVFRCFVTTTAIINNKTQKEEEQQFSLCVVVLQSSSVFKI